MSLTYKTSRLSTSHQPISSPGEPLVALPYSIAGSSPHSGRYSAEKIIYDQPTDQSSRFSGATGLTTSAWILLKLDRPALLKTIMFGKHSKVHPCNTKNFQLFAGSTESRMMEIFKGTLKNDIIAETFAINHVNDASIAIPTRFVKIVPLAAYGPSFNPAIWHVSMRGIADETLVAAATTTYEEYRETITLKHVLKYLRQRRLLSPYQSILERSGLQIESPLVTHLHENIVLQGNWTRAEALLQQASDEGLFASYLRASKPYAIWSRMSHDNGGNDSTRPCRRGGHAMCIDESSGVIYLFGGWDGHHALEDFWAYDIKLGRWRIITRETSKEKNGPGARSCHKMVFDTKTGSIYLLGRLNDEDLAKSNLMSANGITSANGNDHNNYPNSTAATTGNPTGTTLPGDPPASSQLPYETSNIPQTSFCSEFYRYRTRGLDNGKWELLTFDTAIAGGPPLIYDHQMVLECESQILYVSGGRIIDGDWNVSKYSGLYMYNIRLSKWRHILPLETTQTLLFARSGHSMVLDPFSRQLFIFGGKRDNVFLMDMYAFNIDTNVAVEHPRPSSSATSAGKQGPHPCFTQRAVIDPVLKEIYVFCGLMKDPVSVHSSPALDSDTAYWIYRYDKTPGQWTALLPDTTKTPYGNKEPLPRYAHQIVYDSISKTIYMHGGNAGSSTDPAFQEQVHDGSNRLTTTTTNNEEDDIIHTAAVPAENNVTGTETEQERGNAKEVRLNDLWGVNLNRPTAEEIIRRATYRLRQQQFREMCESTSRNAAVKALNFLQTSVYTVVDDSDPEESKLFRSLLMHLLSPINTDTSHQDVLLGEDGWTNELHSAENDDDGQDAIMSDANTTSAAPAPPPPPPPAATRVYTASVGIDALRAIVDPIERLLAESTSRAATRTSSGDGSNDDDIVLTDEQDQDDEDSVSAARFAERTSVFEALLRFFEEGDKQPDAELVDMIAR